MRSTYRQRTLLRAQKAKLRSEEGKMARLLKAERVMRDYEAAHWAFHKRGVSLTFRDGRVGGVGTDGLVSVRKLEVMAQQLWARVHEGELDMPRESDLD